LETIPWFAAWMLIGLWALNLVISWWNARVVGLMWSETKQIGGYPRAMAWAGWLMSGSGFSWCFLLPLLLGAYYLQPMKPGVPPAITPELVQQGLSLGYLILIPGILLSGFMIWVDSVVTAWRRRDFASVGVASWNTFAQVHNTYSAVQGLPEVLGDVGSLFKGGDGKSKAGLLIIILVIVAIIAGFLTTSAIVGHYAGQRDLPEPDEDQVRRRLRPAA
jgi:hypothetical protein